MTPRLPKAWTVRGDVPNADHTASDEELELLDEDLIQISAPQGRYLIDAGWYPAGQRDGRFVCRIVTSDDWEAPIEQVEVKTKDGLRQWIKRAIEEVQWRLGRQGEFSKQSGVWIYALSSTGRVKKSAKPKKLPAQVVPEIKAPGVRPETPGSQRLPQVSSSSTTPLRVRPELLHAA